MQTRWRDSKSQRDDKKVAGVWKARQRLEPPVQSTRSHCALEGRENVASFRLSMFLPPLLGRIPIGFQVPAVSPPATIWTSLRDWRLNAARIETRSDRTLTFAGRLSPAFVRYLIWSVIGSALKALHFHLRQIDGGFAFVR